MFTCLSFSLDFLVLALVELGRLAFFGDWAHSPKLPASTSSVLHLVSNSYTVHKATSNQSSTTMNCPLNRLSLVQQTNTMRCALLTVNHMFTDLDGSCISTLVFHHQVVVLAELSLHLLFLFSAHIHRQTHINILNQLSLTDKALFTILSK